MSRIPFLCLMLFALLLAVPASADDKEPVPDSGTLNAGSNVYTVDYKITGVDLWKNEQQDTRYWKFFGYADSPSVTISGQFNISAQGPLVNEYSAKLLASTREYDDNGEHFSWPDYQCDGQVWEWEGSLDSRDTKDKLTDTVPFSFTIPVPAYNEEADVRYVYFSMKVHCNQYDYRWGDAEKHWNYCHLQGTIAIPEDMVPEPVPVLSATNGGQLDPLRLKLHLTDNSENPPAPIKNAVLKVKAPLPSKPGNVIKDYFNQADWSLSGYFKSRTKCPNCKTIQNQSQFTADNYYNYLEDPSEPIEVLTGDDGRAELEFFLDLPALGDNGPRRDRPLKIPITVEYYGTEGDDKGRLLTESKLNITLSHLGYIESVTYVQPQEWEPWGGLGDYKPAEFHPGEYPLANYSGDQGTGLPYDDVRGADRARFTAANNLVAPGWGNGVAGGSLELNAPSPSVRLQPGMLFSYGDRIDLDARGLTRLKPLDKTDPAYGITAKPGWVWVKVRFFDGLRAKVGVSGNCGQHALVFGNNPEKSGWMPTGKAFVYWAGREAAEQVVSKFIPIYGQVDLVCDVAGYINWANNATPHYIRVQSGFTVHREDDGSATITVREGHPAVVNAATGFTGKPAAAGQTARVTTQNSVSVTATSAEEASAADSLLGTMVKTPVDTGLKPVEAGEQSGFDLSDSGGEFPDGIVDIDDDDYAEEGGDVPAITDDDGNEIIYPGEDTTTYRFDEFLMELEGDWDYEPETDESFAKLGNDDLILYMIVLRTEATTEQIIELLEFDTSEPLKITIAGRSARWIPLFEDGEEFGSLLCFDEPMENGNNLYINFISGAEIWEGLRDDLVKITEGMRFLY